MNVLFVCTGNTCRSPMAETLMDDAVDRSSSLHGNVKINSAGTFACEDAEATPEAVRVMREDYGLSIRRHEAEQFSPELAEWADLILAMDREHMEHLEVIAPEQTHKMHTLAGYVNGVTGEPVDEQYDILDPFGEGLEEYRACAAQLKQAIEKLVAVLERHQQNTSL